MKCGLKFSTPSGYIWVGDGPDMLVLVEGRFLDGFPSGVMCGTAMDLDTCSERCYQRLFREMAEEYAKKAQS